MEADGTEEEINAFLTCWSFNCFSLPRVDVFISTVIHFILYWLVGWCGKMLVHWRRILFLLLYFHNVRYCSVKEWEYGWYYSFLYWKQHHANGTGWVKHVHSLKWYCCISFYIWFWVGVCYLGVGMLSRVVDAFFVNTELKLLMIIIVLTERYDSNLGQFGNEGWYFSLSNVEKEVPI